MNLFSKILTLIKNISQIFLSLPRKLHNELSTEFTPKGMGVDLIKYIIDAANAMPSMHDIKIKLQSNLHKFLVAQGYPTHPRNKSIKLEMKTDSSNITVKVLVYPQSVHLDIGCTNEPFPLLPAGGAKLASLLNRIRQFLCEQSSHRADIPEIGQWMMTRHDRGRDGELTYDGEKFHITIANMIGGFAQIYSKEMHDGSLITRIEQVRTEKVRIKELLHSMERG